MGDLNGAFWLLIGAGIALGAALAIGLPWLWGAILVPLLRLLVA
ncbi:hypothetical protein [Thauera sinica]|uniref:Uncharacterized protein n=1 Tax=Thauera sinica TaxID=2665146 RepID=A0ABW1ART7_9RHOO|nr:hypothetical protein [Thauera sp. K11]